MILRLVTSTSATSNGPWCGATNFFLPPRGSRYFTRSPTSNEGISDCFAAETLALWLADWPARSAIVARKDVSVIRATTKRLATRGRDQRGEDQEKNRGSVVHEERN